MSRILAAAAAMLAAAAAGCGFGEGERGAGEAVLTVTRGYGAEQLLESRVEDPAASDTVLRVLDREAEISTRYGGRFVQSIEGVAGGGEDGRRLDWFFYVNGLESPVGAAEVKVRPGDRIWWDFRDWTDAMRVPAVVGSWPKPLDAEVELRCLGRADSCEAVAERVEAEGGEVETRRGLRHGGDSGDARVLVGPWALARRDPVAATVERGPETSGVFADFVRAAAGFEISVLDERAAEVKRLGAGAGIVAAVRRGEDPPTWLVTGTDAAGVQAAAAMLDADELRDRYALAVARDGEETPLPAGTPK